MGKSERIKAMEKNIKEFLSAAFKKQRVIPIPLKEVEIDEKTLEQMGHWLKPLMEVDDKL